MAGKYFSAAPCKPRREKNVGHHALWQMWIQSCDHYEEAEAHQEGNTCQMRSWWLSTTKIEGVTKSLWSINNEDVICLSWHITITAALAKANTLCLLTECLRSESWKLVAQLCLTFCEPHGLQQVRLLCPRNSPSKSTGVVANECLYCTSKLLCDSLLNSKEVIAKEYLCPQAIRFTVALTLSTITVIAFVPFQKWLPVYLGLLTWNHFLL